MATFSVIYVCNMLSVGLRYSLRCLLKAFSVFILWLQHIYLHFAICWQNICLMRTVISYSPMFSVCFQNASDIFANCFRSVCNRVKLNVVYVRGMIILLVSECCIYVYNIFEEFLF